VGKTVASVDQQQRNVAVDAYRGLVMLLMMGEVLRFSAIARAFPASHFWQFLAYCQTHVEWSGMSLHDTIQPSFTFLVGVALPYSIRSRQRKGDSFKFMLGHTIWRSFILVALGIFLRSMESPMTNFTFEDTLTQIGLGYTFAFLLTFCRAGNGARWRPSCLLTGWRGRSIRRLGPISHTLQWVCLPNGIISTPVSHRIGTRTAISGRRSMCGS